MHVGRSSDLRAAARRRAADLLPSLPGSVEPVLLTGSFPLTAAGQSRNHTGFPLATPVNQANRRKNSNLRALRVRVKSFEAFDTFDAFVLQRPLLLGAHDGHNREDR